MSNQMSIFDFMYEHYQPKKKIRLIELFAGIGAQYKALKEITKGTDYEVESYKICEWAVPSIKAYNSIHIQDYNDYSKGKSIDDMLEKVKMVSLNYNDPINEKSIKSKGEKWLRDVYNNIIATHNLVNVMEVKGSDLEIVDTDQYEYVMSYSFPCQDLSKAGKHGGLEVSQKDGGTRSGLLWEVERILNELDYEHRPNVLLMENVPDLLEVNFVKSWHKWFNALEALGYTTYCEVLNSKNYGIPQNRRRVFAISIKQKEINYRFPIEQELKYKLGDLLEKKVDEKYFLTREHIERIDGWKSYERPLENIMEESSISATITTHVGKDSGGMKLVGVEDKDFVSKHYENYAKEHDGKTPDMFNPYNEMEIKDVAPAQTTNCGSITSSSAVLIKKSEMKSKLCEELIKSGIEENSVIRHSYTANRLNNGEKNKKRIESQDKGLAPTLDTRCDCLGVAVNDEPKVIGGVGEKKSNGGRQYYLQDRIYDGKVANSITTAFNPWYKTHLRIRKLTPCECMKLMGFEKKDYLAMRKIGMTDMQIYHCAGDSIVVNVLMGIFAELLGIDNYSKLIEKYTDQIVKEVEA